MNTLNVRHIKVSVKTILNFIFCSLLIFLSLINANNLLAARDYFIHTEAYNPQIQQQPWTITVNELNGAAMIPPDDACGMRFEGDWNLVWSSDDYKLIQNIATNGGADVYLPRPTCGAWNGVVVEPDGKADYAPPHDFNGRIETYSNGYWINSNGEKLIYKYQPCTPMPNCIIGSQRFVANNWSRGLNVPIQELQLTLNAIEKSRTLSIILKIAERAAATAATAEKTLIKQLTIRRGVNTGNLEKSIRQLEDTARSGVVAARTSIDLCINALHQNNRNDAYRACNSALLQVQRARFLLDTGDAWVQ
ncbi:MAG: hypothetical protein E6Q62_08915 [Nitrosomonas sp.]|nr:MAG: hypothetical protein E6Q62_08915 [Nitrosomonas sp.]